MGCSACDEDEWNVSQSRAFLGHWSDPDVRNPRATLPESCTLI
jgi:hypothetical protein